MDKMKRPNDEELEKVIGGVDRTYYKLIGGKVLVTPDRFCCQNPTYYRGGGGVYGRPICMNCKYYDGTYCTNPGFIAEVTNG